MSVELFSVVTTALLLLVLAVTSGALYGKQVGNSALMGNREGIAPATGAARRAVRAHQNLVENALPFATVVLAAQALHLSTPLTQGAAIIFVVARVVHALVYIAGIPGIRTLAWLAGVAATAVIASALVI
ncbi:hypothetical protein ATY81_25310 [Rhizobium sp. R72]|uniref:MAPEG family protein n=1 Tax=unclassified Rhizobium TaxID=2613769 RepID=UPI000B52F8F6|nr:MULTISPECIES: MAPEG family protein [unclassified Rhizobium]OWW00116.1 hypothetical protein ATY81_25310 [Rhizobium sp. R72]OWW00507.1 hypothetical protein ATY80_25310 [Rhizobium sp. R711]